MTMKALIAAAFLALGLLSTAVGAQAASSSPYYNDYPEWASRAFEPQN
jgi:hypothetical protein